MPPTTLREQLIRDEGARRDASGRHMPYRDSLGFLTIGFGRCLDRIGISEAEAAVLLNNDIAVAEAAVAANVVGVEALDEARMGVLVAMCFNLGLAGLLGFRRFLGALRAQDWERAAAEMLDSRWHEQVGARAERLVEQMRTGIWT